MKQESIIAMLYKQLYWLKCTIIFLENFDGNFIIRATISWLYTGCNWSSYRPLATFFSQFYFNQLTATNTYDYLHSPPTFSKVRKKLVENFLCQKSPWQPLIGCRSVLGSTPLVQMSVRCKQSRQNGKNLHCHHPRVAGRTGTRRSSRSSSLLAMFWARTGSERII